MGWLAALLAACEAPPADGGTAGGTSPDAAPARIVAVGVELGRVLVEFGLADRVVGVDSPSLDVAELGHASDLGPPEALSTELARSLRPDLVLVLAGASQPAAAFARELREQGFRVHLLDPRSANQALEAIHRIGRIVGNRARAAEIAARLTREVSEVAVLRDGRSRLAVAWVLARDPFVVVGASGFRHEILELAGAENAFHAPPREEIVVTLKELAARKPDVVVGASTTTPVLPGARTVAIDPDLAKLPLLDVPGRVRALHRALYDPVGGPGPRRD